LSEVRILGILRTSPFGCSAKFAYTEFHEVRQKRVENTAFERYAASPSGRMVHLTLKPGRRERGLTPYPAPLSRKADA
jgi:hypothetical protein